MAKKWTKAALQQEYAREKRGWLQHMDADYPAYVKDCKQHDEEPVSRGDYRQMALQQYPSYDEWYAYNRDVFEA